LPSLARSGKLGPLPMAERAPRASLPAALRFFLVLPALLASGPAFAQQYGQWSWEGMLGGTARSCTNSLDYGRTRSLPVPGR